MYRLPQIVDLLTRDLFAEGPIARRIGAHVKNFERGLQNPFGRHESTKRRFAPTLATMAGPTAAILVRAQLTNEHIESVRAIAMSGADAIQGHDFWLKGRPFILSVGAQHSGALEGELEGGLELALGWQPEDIISVAAMCNDDEDHRLLAEVCLRLCESFDGIVSFGGRIAVGPVHDSSHGSDPLRIENPSGLPGVLYATSYETAAGSYVTAHFADATFMRAWLTNPGLRMIK